MGHKETNKERNIEMHGRLQEIQGDTKEKQHHLGTLKEKNQYQGSHEVIRPCIHIPLGWMDARSWYHLTKFLSQYYYMYSSHVLRMKHF